MIKFYNAISAKSFAEKQKRVDEEFPSADSHHLLLNTIRKINIFSLAGIGVSLNREKIWHFLCLVFMQKKKI